MTDREKAKADFIALCKEQEPIGLTGDKKIDGYLTALAKLSRLVAEVKGDGSDSVSKEAVIKLIREYIHEIVTESGEDKNAHTNRVLREIIERVEELPTPGTGKEENTEA